MTRNDPLNKLEWSIRPHSGVDSAQWDWGIRLSHVANDEKVSFCHAMCSRDSLM